MKVICIRSGTQDGETSERVEVGSVYTVIGKVEGWQVMRDGKFYELAGKEGRVYNVNLFSELYGTDEINRNKQKDMPVLIKDMYPNPDANKTASEFKGIYNQHKEKEPELKKPPIGLMPRKIHSINRIVDIKEAIQRYTEANLCIPTEWVEEYNELMEEVRNK